MAAGREPPASDSLPLAQEGTAGERSPARGVFVGREHETAALHTALEDALAGRGRLVLLAGEPGIGKSRLADELSAKARRRGVEVLWGRCWEAGGAPAYWPWVQSMRTHVRDCAPEALRAELASGAGDIAQILPELRELFPDLPAAPAAQSEDARFRLFDSMATFLRNAAETHPLLLVLDDLHAADTPSLLLLRFVAGELGQSRIVLVGAYRDTEVGPDHPLAATVAELSRERSASLLRLGGVAQSELSQYLEHTTGVVAPRDLAAAIYEETEGNPLFFSELVRLLAAEGRLEAPMVTGARRFAIPRGLREVIDRRLDRLPDESRPLLTLASVLGREFTLDALARLSGLPADELLPMLDEAIAAGVVAEAPATFGRLRFSHVVIRDVLYDELTAAGRVKLHRKVGEELEALYAHDPEPHLAELAHHFFAGLSGADVGRTVQYARRAGDRASALLAYEEGARLYRMALQALALRDPPDEEMRCELLLRLGDAQARAGDVPTAQETFLQAADVARKRNLPEHLARAALGYGGRFVWEAARGDTRLVPLLEQALEALGERDSPLRARLLARLAGGPLRDEPDRTRRAALSEQAVAMARRLGDPATLAYTLDGRYAAIWWPDNLEERVEVATELARVAREAGDKERELQGRHYRCLALLELGDMPAVYADLQGKAGLADELRQPAQQWYVASVRATLATFEGRFAEAEQLVPEAFSLGRRAQGSMASAYFTIQSYLLRLGQGRLEEVADVVGRATTEFPTYPVLSCVLAHLYSELGQEASARQAFESVFTGESPDFPQNDEWLFGMSLLSDVSAFVGDRRRAALLQELLLPYAGRTAVSTPDGCLGSVSRPLGVLSATLGLWQEAAGQFEEALEMNLRCRARPWVARTQYDFASMLLGREDREERVRAAGLLESALQTARELGMAGLEQKLMATRADLGGEPKAPRGATVFRREGDYWSIAYEGDAFRLKDAKGLRYLAELLANPGREIHVLELAAAGEPPSRAGRRELDESGLAASGPGDAGEILDPQARAAYKRRLEELREELDEAEAWSDSERASRAREEMDFLSAELSRAFGLGGRARRAGSPAERARQSVTKAIKVAEERIAEHSPALGGHLATTVRTGSFCRYTPDPRAPIVWQL